MQIVNRKSRAGNFYSDLFTAEEKKQLAHIFRKKRGEPRPPRTLEDEQKLLRILILRLARGLFGDAGTLWNVRTFNREELGTVEKILSAIGHLATLERGRTAASVASGGSQEHEDDGSLLRALGAKDPYEDLDA